MTLPSSGPFCLCAAHPSSSAPPSPAKIAVLWRVFMLVSVFAGCEFGVGSLSHSLSLQADSGHMLSDGAALAIALLATWFAQRSSSRSLERRQGSRNIELWAALVNGLGLLVMATLIMLEAYRHWHTSPTEILSMPMLITAVIGLVINGISLRWLRRFQDDSQASAQELSADLNVQAASLHVLADVLGSVGVILAAIAVWMWGWTWADTAISVGLALLIGGSALPLVRQSMGQLWGPSGEVERSPSCSIDSMTDLSATGFCEVGQTNLSDIIGRQ